MACCQIEPDPHPQSTSHNTKYNSWSATRRSGCSRCPPRRCGRKWRGCRRRRRRPASWWRWRRRWRRGRRRRRRGTASCWCGGRGRRGWLRGWCCGGLGWWVGLVCVGLWMGRAHMFDNPTKTAGRCRPSATLRPAPAAPRRRKPRRRPRRHHSSRSSSSRSTRRRWRPPKTSRSRSSRPRPPPSQQPPPPPPPTLTARARAPAATAMARQPRWGTPRRSAWRSGARPTRRWRPCWSWCSGARRWTCRRWV